MIQRFLWSLTFRPYVTIFLLAFLALSWLEQGKLRTVIWLVSSYLVALAAEWGSINFGVPFGRYIYHYEALERDLLVFGVPFFDSLSFSFLSYVSFSLAQFLLAPLDGRGFNVRSETFRKTRNSVSALMLGAMLMVTLDLIVDPLALLGKHWFLGDIYHYAEPGIHFGVPLSNYAGWFIVAFVTIFINQRVDEFMAVNTPNESEPLRWTNFPLGGLFAPLLWVGIALFQLGMTYWLAFGGTSRLLDRELIMRQAVAGSLVLAPILAIVAVRLYKRRFSKLP